MFGMGTGGATLAIVTKLIKPACRPDSKLIKISSESVFEIGYSDLLVEKSAFINSANIVQHLRCIRAIQVVSL